jgi:undecaprenyl-diphosphatase
MSLLGIFIFTKVASTTTLVICLLLIVLLLFKIKASRKALSLLTSSIGLFSAVTIAKGYFQVARPVDSLINASGYAFPSGHAAGVTFLAVVVSFLSSRLKPTHKYPILATGILTTAAISYSRIILHVHTLFQVLVGMVFGAFFGFLFIYLSKR